MLDTDLLKLTWIAWLVYDGDCFAACSAFEQFDSTSHINCVNLARILNKGIDISGRTHDWLVGRRRLPLSEFINRVARADGRVKRDIAEGWVKPVLIRRSHL
jgi:hypothetical protein